MGCILIRIIVEHEKFELYNKIKIFNNDLIEKGNLYIKNCNCKCNTKEMSKSGIINYNVDTLISSYFCFKFCKIRRAVNNQIYPEGSLESRVGEALNNVFLLLTSLCEFYDYEISNLFYRFLINLIKQSLIIFILTIMIHDIKTTICVSK